MRHLTRSGSVNREYHLQSVEKLSNERDALRLRLAEVERERDDARRVAKRMARTGQEGCATDADRDAFDAAVRTALAYEVEP